MPPGYVIPTGVAEEVFGGPDLKPARAGVAAALEDGRVTALEEAAAAIREALQAAPLPEELRADLRRARESLSGDVAVRSSASFEDSTIASFDFGSIYYSVSGQPGTDHDGDGTVEPFQTEVSGMLSDLKNLLTGAGVPFDDTQGLFNLTQMASRTTTERAAAYNYDFVVEDGSLGYHNPIYVVNLLAASISALP